MSQILEIYFARMSRNQLLRKPLGLFLHPVKKISVAGLNLQLRKDQVRACGRLAFVLLRFKVGREVYNLYQVKRPADFFMISKIYFLSRRHCCRSTVYHCDFAVPCNGPQVVIVHATARISFRRPARKAIAIYEEFAGKNNCFWSVKNVELDLPRIWRVNIMVL